MIFVVYRCYYDYDGGSHTNLGYALDPETAQRTVDQWERRKARSVEVFQAARNWLGAWDKQNPAPKFGPELPKIPHAKVPKKKLTAVQLEERTRAEAAHKVAREKDSQSYSAWAQRRWHEYELYLKTEFTEQELTDSSNGRCAINDDFAYEELQELT